MIYNQLIRLFFLIKMKLVVYRFFKGSLYKLNIQIQYSYTNINRKPIGHKLLAIVLYHTIPLGSAKINYFTLDTLRKNNYRRFVPKISRIMLVKCLKFEKLLILESMEEISICCAIFSKLKHTEHKM
jgi:hypothetical protein